MEDSASRHEGVVSGSSRPSRASGTAEEEADPGWVNKLTEEAYQLVKDTRFPGVRGKRKRVKLLERQPTARDRPREPGEQVSTPDYCETVDISCLDKTETTTEREQRDDPSWTLGNLGAQMSTPYYSETMDISCLDQTAGIPEREQRDDPSWTLGNQGAQMSTPDYCDTVDFSCFDQTAGIPEREQTDDPFWTLGNLDMQLWPDDYWETVVLTCYDQAECLTASEPRDDASWALENQGEQVSTPHYWDTVGISCLDQTEDMPEREQRDDPSWTLGNQGTQLYPDDYCERAELSSFVQTEGAQASPDDYFEIIDMFGFEQSESMTEGAQVSPGVYCKTMDLSSFDQTEGVTEKKQGDFPSWTLGIQGAQVSTHDHCERVGLSCFDQTEEITEREQRGAQVSPDVHCETVELSSFEQTEGVSGREQRYDPSRTSKYPGTYKAPDDYCQTMRLSSFEQTKGITTSEQGDDPFWTSANQGTQVSPSDYCETVEISCFDETEGTPVSPPDYCEVVEVSCFDETESDDPSWTFGNEDAQVFIPDYCETVEVSLFDETEGMRESEQRDDPFWTLGDQAQESTTEALIEDSSTKTRRSRSRRRRNRRARRRDENSLHPYVRSECLMRFHDSTSPMTFEQVSINASRNEPRKTFRHQIPRPVLQNRERSATYVPSNQFSGQYSTHTARNRKPTQPRTRHTLLAPDLQINSFPGEDSPSDISPFRPKKAYNSDNVENVLDEARNIFSRAEEAGIRSNVGTLRRPAFRSSNTGLIDTRSVATQRGTLGRRMTGSGRCSNLMNTDRDVQRRGLPPTQNTCMAESQRRRNSSNFRRRVEPHRGATTTCNPSSRCTPGPSSHPMFSARSHNENPEVASETFEGINERRAPVGSRSQPRQGRQHARWLTK
ncbi:PREDICTED: uncharacterized protein LOC102020708 [Chinchilla lanigera]|uniref:uncharacterized protein LOC102020708 n=1 Tax=Chinchilla lanigera TaxID=34839 RepID=UPI00038F17FA|nr:PREDICTED: uncharacterized protein LOC102020708 [Chinchilla lanigera]